MCVCPSPQWTAQPQEHYLRVRQKLQKTKVITKKVSYSLKWKWWYKHKMPLVPQWLLSHSWTAKLKILCPSQWLAFNEQTRTDQHSYNIVSNKDVIRHVTTIAALQIPEIHQKQILKTTHICKYKLLITMGLVFALQQFPTFSIIILCHYK